MKFDERRWRVFGNWLKDRRRYEHLSQEAAAQEAGISRRHFIRIEQGKIEVPAETVRRLARAVTAPEDSALVRAGYTPSPTEFDLETRVKQVYRDLLEDDLVSAIQRLLDDYSLLSQKRAALKSPDKWKMSMDFAKATYFLLNLPVWMRRIIIEYLEKTEERDAKYDAPLTSEMKKSYEPNILKSLDELLKSYGILKANINS